jgi:hypothetical protein
MASIEEFSGAIERSRAQPALLQNPDRLTFSQIVGKLASQGYSAADPQRATRLDKPGWSAWIVHVRHAHTNEFDLLFFLPQDIS